MKLNIYSGGKTIYKEYILSKLPHTHTHRHTQHVHTYNINIQKMIIIRVIRELTYV